MSHGSYTHDLRTRKSLSCGVALVGRYASKSWSGGDQDPPRSLPLSDHPYTMKFRYLADPEISWAFKNRPDQFYKGTVTSCFGGPSFSDPWGANDDLLLLAKLVAKIKRFAFNAAVAAVEGNQTFGLLGDNIKRLSNSFEHVRRGDMRRAAYQLRARRPRKIHQDISSNWLELRYGWQPLLSDIHGGAEAMAEFLGTKPFIQSYKAQLTRVAPVAPNSLFTTIGSRTIVKRVICRFNEDLTVGARLGLLNPEQVLWEKVPYSFVADWIYPIGTWLDTWGTLSNIPWKQFVQSTLDIKECYTVSSGSSYLIVPDASYRYKSVDYTRVVGSSLDVPYPRRQPLSSIASWKHCADAVALCVQRFSGGKRRVR